MKRNSKLSTGCAAALLLLLGACVQLGAVRGSPVGAPAVACEDMTPHHNGNEPQTSVPPYQLAASTDAAVAGDAVTVVLSSDSGELFKGFFIQARDVATDEIIGTFQTEEWKYVDCDPGVENAVTHPNNSTKSSVTVDWIAPADYTGVIAFRATVVRQFDTFWLGIQSGEVTVAAARGNTLTRTPKSLREAYDGCNVTKGCFGIMGDCVTSQDCMVTITYAKATGGYYIEVFGIAETTDVYMAGGLSFDTSMANTSVMACRSYQGVADVVMAFNTVGHSNSILPIPDMGLSDVTVSHVDGLLYCGFLRESSLVVGGFLYDLDADQFYLEVAHGNLSDTGDLTHHKHHGVTPDLVSLGDYS
jgi:hypothetical protein